VRRILCRIGARVKRSARSAEDGPEDLEFSALWAYTFIADGSREQAAMKNMLMLSAAVMVLAGSAPATPPPIGYIGIFNDATHTTTYSFCPALYEQFRAWI
jgi:hypothetical protein